MKKLLTKLLGDPASKKLKQLEKRVSSINELSDAYKKLSDKKLQAKAGEFRAQVEKGVSLDEILPDVFAMTREMAERTVGMRHFDVQLIGGMALHEGNVAEMRTGEGKTLVATLPVVLNALTGKGVHVVTVNDYLARRDAGWMAQVYHALGLSTSVIIAQESYMYDPEFSNEEHDDERLRHLKPVSRQEAYAADITYGTNNEFGFDYLRDNMVRSEEQLRQRELAYAIVDEVDSILIDEARTPLIISAPASTSSSSYQQFAKAVRQLDETHYELDEKRRTVNLNDEGIQKIQDVLGVENLYDSRHVQMVYHIDQALRAETLFKRDKNYVIRDGEIIIVDEFTGRLMQGRRYSEGLHQAIEAKEGVEVLQESMTLATISFQNYFRLYNKLAGMTGTAETESEEFHTIYKLDVIVIPTNMPIARDDKPDRVYKTEKGKFQSVVEDVKKLHEKGQPVLLGTASIEKNEFLSNLLTRAKIPHEVLNAKNNEREAAIVAQAGQKGAVTLATNIAGRGTDIVLSEEVKKLGGLFVIGTERHESRRIDNQLRGRAGRQGDKGATQFYVSLEDELMRIFGGERMKKMMSTIGVDDTTPIESKSVSRVLENAQKKVEDQNFDSRKNVVKYDDVMNRHRKATYSRRRKVLMSESVKKDIEDMIEEEVAILTENPPLPAEGEKKTKEELRLDHIKEIATVFPLNNQDRKKLADATSLKSDLLKKANSTYKKREKDFGADVLRQVEREVYLQVMDSLWMQHLENMQHLREGITWRSIGQRDPLVEYRREGQVMFEQMEDDLRSELIRTIYRVVPRPVEVQEEVETDLTKAAAQSSENTGDKAPSKTKAKKTRRAAKSRPTPVRSTSTSKSKRKKKKQKRQNRKKSRK